MKSLIAFLFLTAITFADKPNIIVIMADDMGYADAGFTGATDIKTPNLNALAAYDYLTKNHGFAKTCFMPSMSRGNLSYQVLTHSFPGPQK